jgi:hypothetical protein
VKCPHCDKEIPGTTCPQCESVNPEGAKFCMECGISLEDKGENTFEDDNIGFDLDDRILCPDGTCTGIIVDGRCTECGKTPDEHEKSEENDPDDQDKT